MCSSSSVVSPPPPQDVPPPARATLLNISALPSHALGQNIFTLPPSPRPRRRTARLKSTTSAPATTAAARRSSVSTSPSSFTYSRSSPPCLDIMLNSPITANIKTQADLTNHYRGYLRALNTGTFDLVGRYVAKRARHNGYLLSHTEYCALIPQGATYTPEDIVADIQGRTIAARLSVEYPANTPQNSTLANSYGHHHSSSSLSDSVNLCDSCSTSNPSTPPHPSSSTNTNGVPGGRSPKVCQINEMVFYHFDEDWRIVEVNSMIQPRRDVNKERGSIGHERGSSRGFGHARSRSP